MKILISILFLLLIIGCGELDPEKHRIAPDGTEYGIEIEVMLTNGGSAKLVCPKFKGEPWGAHGRECYLRSYNKKL